MKMDGLKALPLGELRALYKKYLTEQDISRTTVGAYCYDAFYLWRKSGQNLFWEIASGDDFENTARHALLKAHEENATGEIEKQVSSYLTALRRFRKFIAMEGRPSGAMPRDGKTAGIPPLPSVGQVEFFLEKWRNLENYRLQEDALNRLFFVLCPKNTDISDILLKVSTLNDFYSTHIFSVYEVARHILSLAIDARLKAGDITLVRDVQHIVIDGAEKNFYSFATKYCSHHNPYEFPIYDNYVDRVLRHFRKNGGFCNFQDEDLKDYVHFKGVLKDFRAFYGLERYSLKQIDQYLWLLGKEFFPKKYGKKNLGSKKG